MSYILPMEDILEATWEFLSGVEQSLWYDEDDEQRADAFSPASFGQDAYVLSPADSQNAYVLSPADSQNAYVLSPDAHVLSPGPFERLVVSDWEIASRMEEFGAR
jgi:hypothetical protein